ncbi:Dihydrofolate reductase [Rhodotorula toruloides]|nr:Dihydrofolate reductase [Rhodotorula toruloides]
MMRSLALGTFSAFRRPLSTTHGTFSSHPLVEAEHVLLPESLPGSCSPSSCTSLSSRCNHSRVKLVLRCPCELESDFRKSCSSRREGGAGCRPRPTAMTEAMKPLSLTLIVAATPSHGIGRNSTLPWRLSKEMAYFARMTKGEGQELANAVIMGRKSWEGIPSKFRPLPGRVNVVVSRQQGFDLGSAPHTHLASSLPSAVDILRSANSSLNRAFLIGGAQLYNATLEEAAGQAPSSSSSYTVDRVLLTRLFTEYPDCDTFLRDFEADTSADGRRVWRQASHDELRQWAGWDVPEGKQTEQDKAVKGEEKLVEYEYQMWVRN